MKSNSIVFIVGVTASGKTATALRIAKELNGEIVCADSQTLRKDLDIGTAKPNAEEQKITRHHMLDLIGPYDRFSVADFKNQAHEAIKDIHARGKLPIVVGGTGLYIDALFYNYNLNLSDVDRKDFEKYSVDELQQMIINRGYDLPTNKSNPRHLIGVLARGGKSSVDNIPVEGAMIYGIQRSDEEIKYRINLRVDKMFDAGLVDEVKTVVEKYGNPPKKLDAICYPIVKRYLDGEISLKEAKEVFKRADWQYARRQKAWFKRNDFIQWYGDETAAANAIIKDVAHS